VHSGYAPISVRPVRCLAQKDGVLSNPALDKVNKPTEGASGDSVGDVMNGSTEVQAHKIVGWKGFEDVLANIPRGAVDFVSKWLAPPNMINHGSIVQSVCLRHSSIGDSPWRLSFSRTNQDYSGIFPWRLCLYILLPYDGLVSKIEVGGEYDTCVNCADRVSGRQVREVGKAQASNPVRQCQCQLRTYPSPQRELAENTLAWDR